MAGQLGASRATACKWLRRYAEAGEAGLADPVRSPRRSGNRYEHGQPGAMIHVDVKKLGRIPPGGGWRLHGRDAAMSVAHRHKKTKIGYDYARTAIDDHTRLAYSEVLADEKDTTCAGFLHRALAWLAGQGVTVRRVLTDNALACRHGGDWGWVCAAWQVKRRFTRPGCPWTNGKAVQPHPAAGMGIRPARASSRTRTRALDKFLAHYNNRRGHSALGGRPPASRLPT